MVLLLGVMLILVILGSCTPAAEHSSLTFKTPGGKGSRQITVSFYKNGKKNHKNEVSDNEDYFPKGVPAAEDFLRSRLPEEYHLRLEETEEQYLFILSYEFEHIQDYNAKTRKLIGEELCRFDDIPFSTLKKVPQPDGRVRIDFWESGLVPHACVQWAYTALCNDGVSAGVFATQGISGDKTNASPDSMYNIDLSQTEVVLGNKKQRVAPRSNMLVSTYLDENGSFVAETNENESYFYDENSREEQDRYRNAVQTEKLQDALMICFSAAVLIICAFFAARRRNG